jgi:hypothetical protein
MALFDDGRENGDGDPGDQASRNLELGGGNHFVCDLDARNRPTHQLRGAQTGDDDKLERIRTRGTLHQGDLLPSTGLFRGNRARGLYYTLLQPGTRRSSRIDASVIP